MLRSSPEVLQGKRVQAGQDCLLLLQWLEATGTELRYGRQAELLEGSIRASNLSSRRTSPNRSRSTQQVWCSSPHDPDAQWSAKGRGKHRKSWVGYKVQIAETLPEGSEESQPPFLVAVVTRKGERK